MDWLDAYNGYCDRRKKRMDVKAFRVRRDERLKKVNNAIDNKGDCDIIKVGERIDAEFEESQHPRAKDGKFAKKGQGESGGVSEKEAEIPMEKPGPNRLAVGGREARELYDRIKNGNYLPIEELLNHPVVKKLDGISRKYDEKYGVTASINTPERQELRKKIRSDFLKAGSARKTKGEDGRDKYVFDGPLKKEHKAQIVIGLPAAGKSTTIANPESQKTGSFVFDSDIIKESIPEFAESFGGAANAVHQESGMIQEDAFSEFLNGSMKGTNMIIPIIGSKFESVMRDWVTPLEEAGYDVEIKYKDADSEGSANRVIARALDEGRIIPSKHALSYGDKPRKVFDEFKKKRNRNGRPYVKDLEG